MEPMSLAVGVVPLYNVTIDVLTRVRDYKDFGSDSSTTIARFDASKLRLQNWAKALGIRNGKLVDPHDCRLDDSRTASVIQNILRGVGKIFDKIEYRSTSLKLPVMQRSASIDAWSLPLDDERNVVERRQVVSARSRIAWATGGKTKLSKDVQSFEGLVNILYEVVAPRESETGSLIECNVPSCRSPFSALN